MMTRADRRPGEFALIQEIFAPLSRSFPGAFGLQDDVAILLAKAGYDLVLKTDSLIERVHFLRSDPAETVGRKALRRALSDLAAKGADPHVYLLALALPEWPGIDWLRAFAGGLATDQLEFGIHLVGGETDQTSGPVTITATVVGHVPSGKLIRRNRARPGDTVFVTGTIGDAAAGLLLARNEVQAEVRTREYLLARFRVPRPRLAFGRAIRGSASAAIDVSDGLLADLGHIAETSGVRIAVDAARIPLSDSFREVRGDGRQAHLAAASGGDDYEIAFAAAPESTPAIVAAARESSTEITAIGRVMAGQGVAFLDETGREIEVPRAGYTHF
jgi:thiamine-monophosphate kinase